MINYHGRTFYEPIISFIFYILEKISNVQKYEHIIEALIGYMK